MTLGRRNPPHAKHLAAAVLVAAGAGLAQAADTDTAFVRAVDHIQAFPGHTAHGADQSYTLRDRVVDADGAQHVRVARLYKGLRVIGGDMVVHINRSGAFVDASRTLRQPLALDTAARLSPAQAAATALQQHGGDTQGRRPELVVYARGEQPALAYDVRVFGEQVDGTPSELHVLVHAHTGAVLDAWDDILTAPAVGVGHSLFVGRVPLDTSTDGAGFSLVDSTRGNSRTLDMNNGSSGTGTLFTDADDSWGNGSILNRQTVAVDAAYGAAMTWNYYQQVHGRTGIGNDGAGADSRVHYKIAYSNAFWSDSCFCMTYGDGNSRLYPFVALDVTGHEMTHGVTSRTAGLLYSDESGGLNEATSDIMGTNVEFFANNPKDPGDYLLGEMLFRPGSGGSFYRSMIHPSLDGVSSDCWYPTVGFLDAHYSSGVANHFYFLLAEGTVAGQPSPTCVASDTQWASGAATVTGITRAKAEKIWYRALTVYLTSNSHFAQARQATLSAAADLYGAGSPEVAAVGAAWSAVNVN